MSKSVRCEVRLPDKLMKNILDLQARYDAKLGTEYTKSEFIRELLEIGYFVKKKQLEDETDGDKPIDYSPLYREVIEGVLESNKKIEAVYNAVFEARKSKFNSAYLENSAIKKDVSEHIDQVVSGDIPNADKKKGEKSEPTNI